jgi:hypothetical protein
MTTDPNKRDESIIGRDFTEAQPDPKPRRDGDPILFDPNQDTDFEIEFESELHDEGGEA